MLSHSRSHGDYTNLSHRTSIDIVSSFDRIMKVTGTDGRTHLSGPSLSSLLTTDDLIGADASSFSYNPYTSYVINQNVMHRHSTYQPRPKPPNPPGTQVMITLLYIIRIDETCLYHL